MSSESPNSNAPASSEDIWAGKSRNAKAQARHRAKRKAYIEQLEQTVSKLQTALALSPEDVSTLPTQQMKIRELKEENDSLRAEIQKLRALVYHPYAMPSLGSQNLGSSDEYPRHAKRRRTTSHELPPRSLYLGSSDTLVDHLHIPQIAPRLMSSTTATPLVSLASPISPIDGPPLREGGMSWTSYNQPHPLTHSPVPPMWALPTHHRSKSSSSSGSSSDASPVLMTQNGSQIQALFPSYKSTSSNAHDASSYAHNSRIIDKHSANILFGGSNVTLQPDGALSKSGGPTIMPGDSTSAEMWTDMPPWSGNSIRLQ